jgi:hypothetical protein
MKVVRADGTCYVEAEPEELSRLIKAKVVEGHGTRNGVIKLLKVIRSESEAMERLSAVRAADSQSHVETRGSLITQASRNIYREPLPEGFWTWTFKQLRAFDFAGARQ